MLYDSTYHNCMVIFLNEELRMVRLYNVFSMCVVFTSLFVNAAGPSDSGKKPGNPGLQRGRCQGSACRFVRGGHGQRRVGQAGQGQAVAAPGTPRRRQLEGQARHVGAIQGQQHACSGEGPCPARRGGHARQAGAGAVRHGKGHHKKGHGQWHGKKRPMRGQAQRPTVPTPSAPPQEQVRAEGSQAVAAVPQPAQGAPKPEVLPAVATSVAAPAAPTAVPAPTPPATPAPTVVQEAPKVPEQKLQAIVSTGGAAPRAQPSGRGGGWQHKKMGKKKWHKGKGKHGKGWHKKKLRTAQR